MRTKRSFFTNGGVFETSRTVMMIAALALLSDARATTQLYPPWSHVSGGKFVETSYFIDGAIKAMWFDNVPALEVGPWSYFCGENEPDEFCVQSYYAITPPLDKAGPVDVLIEFLDGGFELVPGGFTYYDAPLVEKVTPIVHSVLPDTTRVTVFARGVSVYPGVTVYFGDRPATDLSIEESSPWTEISCLPPAFPGGAVPLTVDVRVVNADSTEGILSEGFTYTRIASIITEIYEPVVSAWRNGQAVVIGIDRLVDGALQVYFDGIPGRDVESVVSAGRKFVFSIMPAHAPGKVSVTIVNGDGGTYTLDEAIEYTGTPSTDFHPGDLDHDFRFSMSEVLRAVQLFNSGGMHCDASSEDGYAPGVGADTSCLPYPSDNNPFNWNLGLTELLEIIQFYNMFCYQPCPGAPGTYCPPD